MKREILKEVYIPPKMLISTFKNVDIITASDEDTDHNQGPWDTN